MIKTRTQHLSLAYDQACPHACLLLLDPLPSEVDVVPVAVSLFTQSNSVPGFTFNIAVFTFCFSYLAFHMFLSFNQLNACLESSSFLLFNLLISPCNFSLVLTSFALSFLCTLFSVFYCFSTIFLISRWSVKSLILAKSISFSKSCVVFIAS